MAVKDLERWRTKLDALIEKYNLLTYPVPPKWGEEDDALFWPEQDGIEKFLALGHTLGVRLVYIGQSTLTQERLDLLAAFATDELGVDEELSKALATARQHVGRLQQVQVSWVFAGQTHVFAIESPWHPEVQEQIDGWMVGSRRSRAQRVDEYAKRLAQEPRFYNAHGGEEGRRYVARQLMPDVERFHVDRIADQAWVIYMNDFLPEQERLLAADVRALLADGVSALDTARRLGLTRSKVDRLLRLYPG